MGKPTRTQKIIAGNKANKDINRLLRKGEAVPLSLLGKVGWKRRISREGL